ncbi:hypothetical protein DPMN_076665 [Dreissena polymorpha]|uniref:Uncharacterized protein n=1 Tax=Dreissena polymorpha TaxID=45954 RepID=A0A9D4BML2_DREPO|nr:hypothetical protein DPMN_076665 [Dreissena polymorpha]
MFFGDKFRNILQTLEKLSTGILFIIISLLDCQESVFGRINSRQLLYSNTDAN